MKCGFSVEGKAGGKGRQADVQLPIGLGRRIRIVNVPRGKPIRLVMIECPTALFKYATGEHNRDSVRDGGFPR